MIRSGCLPSAVIPTFPEASIQSLTPGSWWEGATSGQPERGRLIRTLVPYPDMKPFRLVAVGRGDDAWQHQRAEFRLEEFRVGDPAPDESTLPVAALPVHPAESRFVRRGKVRPCIILATGGPPVARELRRGAASWQSNQTLLVAPYYGIDSDGTRGGWNPEFVRRIQRAEYSQYLWDVLPIGGPESGSILRLDHVFPVGADPSNWRLMEFRLSQAALEIVDEWLAWHLTGALVEDSAVACARAMLAAL